MRDAHTHSQKETGATPIFGWSSAAAQFTLDWLFISATIQQQQEHGVIT
jgi:hypothetical protein